MDILSKAPEPQTQPRRLSSTAELRQRARKRIEEGAVTPSYRANRAMVLKHLNHALATELVCILRYRRHYFMAQGLPAEAIKQEFLEHANEEQQHADMLAGRIIQLGGEPDFNPEGLAIRSHAEYGTESSSLVDMLRDDLVAERVAIESYSEFIQYIGDDDPTTKRLLEHILSAEEEHAEEIASLLAQLEMPKQSQG